jgi:hypothetical protein
MKKFVLGISCCCLVIVIFIILCSCYSPFDPCSGSNWGSNYLCSECEKIFFDCSIGTCESCARGTSSGAFRLCNSCACRLKQCQHCRKTLD